MNTAAAPPPPEVEDAPMARAGAVRRGAAHVGKARDADGRRCEDARTSGGGGDLREIIEAYHGVTERLQQSHETLQHEVLRLREQLASTDAQLQRSKRLAALGEMAAGIAHEVRNPLAAIGLYAEMIADDGDLVRGAVPASAQSVAASVCGNAAKITDAVRGLSGIVSDVLSFSRQIEPRVQVVDAAALLSRVLDAHAPELERHGVAVHRQIEVDELPGDAGLLHQALLNLVRNAVDAMATPEVAEAVRPRVLTLAVTPDPEDAGGVRLVVADTGPGIDDDAVDRIFNPFFTTRSTGTGLGLAIVHRIVDAHGGSIAVHNDPGCGGAVFTLSLPKTRVESDKSKSEGSAVPSASTPASTPPTTDCQPSTLDFQRSTPKDPA